MDTGHNIKWEPDNFQLETTSVWSFPDRGDWATHDGKYRGNWSPYVPRNLILRYTKENDLVLDQFVGGGTTLVEAKLLGRNAIGVDVNPDALERCKKKLDFKVNNNCKTYIYDGDARDLEFISDNSIDLICTHPPYADIIKYSENIESDISHLETKKFLAEMKLVAGESYRVLKKGKYCAVLMGDTRKKGFVNPLGTEVMHVFQEAGFILKEMVIKQQHNCQSTGYWKKRSIEQNFLLLVHEYLYIFRK